CTGQAVSDVWRLTDGQIIEHRDGFQNLPAETVSGNSMFSDVYTYPQGAPMVSEAQEESSRQMVVSAFTDLFNYRNLQLLDQLWDPRYFQHNPRFPNGTAGLAGLVGSSTARSSSTGTWSPRRRRHDRSTRALTVSALRTINWWTLPQTWATLPGGVARLWFHTRRDCQPSPFLRAAQRCTAHLPDQDRLP